MPSSSLYRRYDTAVIPQALLPDQPKDDTFNAGSSRLAVRLTWVRKEQARNELTRCKERERGAPVWVYRTPQTRRRSRVLSAFHSVLRSSRGLAIISLVRHERLDAMHPR